MTSPLPPLPPLLDPGLGILAAPAPPPPPVFAVPDEPAP